MAVSSSDRILLGFVGSTILAVGNESRILARVLKKLLEVSDANQDRLRALITVTSSGNEGNSSLCNFRWL